MTLERQIKDWEYLWELSRKIREEQGRQRDIAIYNFLEGHKKYRLDYNETFRPYRKPKEK